MKNTPLGYFLMKERYFLEQIIVLIAVFIVTIADPLEKLSWSWQDILEHLAGGFLSESGYIASWRKDRFE